MNALNTDYTPMIESIKMHFGVATEVGSMIAHAIDVSATAHASVFLNRKKQLYCLITAQSRLTLGDIKKIVTHMGLKAELFVPPKGQPNYFDDVGTAKFREVFPGRKTVSQSDIAYYRTLAPYNPALVIVSEIREGVIYQYDRDAHSGWRPSVKFAYRRIKTS